MFKVICVDANPYGLTYMACTPPVFVGSEYEVVQVVKPRDLGYIGPLADKDFYFLKEHGLRHCYMADMFAPIDGPNEIEIAEARAEREGTRLDCELVSLIERIEYA